MNERIRELDQQAVDYANNVCDANGIYKGKEYLTVVKEKFAELIVRECADLLKKEAESSHDEGTETYNLLLKESKWMKKHFGVEE